MHATVLCCLVVTSLAMAGCKAKNSNHAPAKRDRGAAIENEAAAGANYQSFSSATNVWAHVMANRPTIVGVGEIHKQAHSPEVTSAMQRFTSEMLASIQPRPGHLVIETWTQPKGCNTEQARTNDQVRTTLARPETNESELVTLARTAKQLGIQPHVLSMTCAEFGELKDDKGINFERLLTMVTHKLSAKISSLIGNASGSAPILVYGGALHNDVFPVPVLADLSYAAHAQRQSKNRYVEVDLLVPELVEQTKHGKSEPWYGTAMKAATREDVLLFKRDLNSFVVILKRGTTKKPRDRRPLGGAASGPG